MSLDERNGELEEKLKHNPIDEQIAALVRADRLRKWQIFALALMAALLAYGWYQNRSLAIQAESNKDAIIRNCETSNESRKNQRDLWAYVISLTPEQPRTETQQNRTDEFQKFVDKTFAQRDCMAEIKKQ